MLAPLRSEPRRSRYQPLVSQFHFPDSPFLLLRPLGERPTSPDSNPPTRRLTPSRRDSQPTPHLTLPRARPDHPTQVIRKLNASIWPFGHLEIWQFEQR